MAEPLSPAAQAVKDAVIALYSDNAREMAWSLDRDVAAVAIRAAADLMKAPDDLGLYGNSYWAGMSAAETKLRAIAAELEGGATTATPRGAQ